MCQCFLLSCIFFIFFISFYFIFIYLFIYLFIHLFNHSFIHLFNLFIYLFICLFIHFFEVELYSNITNNMKSIAPKPIGASKGRPPNVLYPVWPSLVGEVGPNSSNWRFLELYYWIFLEGIAGKYLRENEDKTLVLGLRAL